MMSLKARSCPVHAKLRPPGQTFLDIRSGYCLLTARDPVFLRSLIDYYVVTLCGHQWFSLILKLLCRAYPNYPVD